jgi:hypothetical protein
VKERSYSSNNKNSDLCRQRKVPSIWAWDIWAATKLQSQFSNKEFGRKKSKRTMRTASRSSNRRLCERKRTVCRVWRRLAGFDLLLFSEVSQELTCGLAKMLWNLQAIVLYSKRPKLLGFSNFYFMFRFLAKFRQRKKKVIQDFWARNMEPKEAIGNNIKNNLQKHIWGLWARNMEWEEAIGKYMGV